MKKSETSFAEVREKVLGLILQVVDELNRENSGPLIQKSADTPLIGPSSVLDSLRLVNFIVAAEQKVEEEFGFAISAIANEKAMSQRTSPLRNISTLADFIAGIVAEHQK